MRPTGAYILRDAPSALLRMRDKVMMTQSGYRPYEGGLHAVHGDRALQEPGPGPGLPARPRSRHQVPRGAEIYRKLDRAEFRPLLPAHGMRRRAPAAGMGARQ